MTAVYYGQTTVAVVGDIVLGVYVSVLTLLPVFVVRTFFAAARPTDRLCALPARPTGK